MTLPSLELEGATLEQLAVLTPLELEGAPLLDEGSLLAPSTENWVDFLKNRLYFDCVEKFKTNNYTDVNPLKVNGGALLRIGLCS